MSCKLFINGLAQKDFSRFTDQEKASLVKALDRIESLGQMGDLIHDQLNVWVYRVNGIRIFFQKKSSKKINVLTIAKGVGPLVKKRCI
jgi:phage-related protein